MNVVNCTICGEPYHGATCGADLRKIVECIVCGADHGGGPCRAVSTGRIELMLVCEYCGNPHQPTRCPRVRSIEYADGPSHVIKRVEFHEETYPPPLPGPAPSSRKHPRQVTIPDHVVLRILKDSGYQHVGAVSGFGAYVLNVDDEGNAL